MNSILDDQSIEFQCECGRKFKEKFGRLKNKEHITCTCGRQILLDTKQAADVERTIDNASKGIGKNFRIKF